MPALTSTGGQAKRALRAKRNAPYFYILNYLPGCFTRTGITAASLPLVGSAERG
jgi:hypothetical protein